MKKMIDLIAGSGSGKDEKLLNYIRKNYLKDSYCTNLCVIYGQGPDYQQHTQLSPAELRELVFKKNNKNTIYFLGSFFFDKDRPAYLKLIEEMCENDIQIFKTDQIEEHVTDDKLWTNKYCQFLNIKDVE